MNTAKNLTCAGLKTRLGCQRMSFRAYMETDNDVVIAPEVSMLRNQPTTTIAELGPLSVQS